MSITVEYKGCEFEFDGIPSEEDLRRRYKRRRRSATQITLPVPEAPILERDTRPYESNFLEGRRIVCHSVGRGSPFDEALAAVELLGAEIEVAEHSSGDGGGDGADGMLFDATGVAAPDDLDELYRFFHSRVGQLDDCGRVVVLGRPPESAEGYGEAAGRRALDAFTRCLAEELGPEGGTANMLTVEEGAEERLFGPLRFFLSEKTAFVSGEPLRVGADLPDHPDGRKEREVLAGKTAVVTGAARGIGYATALQLKREGADVICMDLPGDELEEAAAELGGTAIGIDISDAAAAERLLEAAGDHGGVDILIHNAGIYHSAPLQDLDAETWRQTLDINLGAPVRLTRTLLEEGALNEFGRILCISSIAGIAGNPRETNYSSSKAGLIGLVEYYAERLTEEGITANAVAPGFVDTAMSAEAATELAEPGWRLNSITQVGEPLDIANTLAFLASPSAQGINGAVLRAGGDLLFGV